MNEHRYKVVRFYCQGNREPMVIVNGLTLEEAQEHCHDRESSSRTCGSFGDKHTEKFGDWFDGYDDDDEE